MTFMLVRSRDAQIVVIETLWNVNDNPDKPGTDDVDPVVIETLWNVNTQYLTSCMWLPLVVIETLWNVNTCT